jgi:hypothetical protein
LIYPCMRSTRFVRVRLPFGLRFVLEFGSYPDHPDYPCKSRFCLKDLQNPKAELAGMARISRIKPKARVAAIFTHYAHLTYLRILSITEFKIFTHHLLLITYYWFTRGT